MKNLGWTPLDAYYHKLFGNVDSMNANDIASYDANGVPCWLPSKDATSDNILDWIMIWFNGRSSSFLATDIFLKYSCEFHECKMETWTRHSFKQSKSMWRDCHLPVCAKSLELASRRSEKSTFFDFLLLRIGCKCKTTQNAKIR